MSWLATAPLEFHTINDCALALYIDKLTRNFIDNRLKSVEVVLMEVPCCGGLAQAARMALAQAKVYIPLSVTTIGVRGENFGTKAF